MSDQHPIDLSPTHGVWEGQETLYPGPGVPERMQPRGRMEIRETLGGRGTTSDYEQHLNGTPTLRCQTVIVADGEDGAVRVHWIPATGAEARVYTGHCRDGMLRAVYEGEGRIERLEQDWSEEGRLRSSMWVVPAEGEPTLAFEGDYRRASGDDPSLGSFGWHDLTVDDAPRLRDFYREVVGWTVEPVSMGNYDDYVLADPDGTGVAGVCHARGTNAGLPPVWINYVIVADLDASLEAVRRLEGRVVSGPSEMGGQGRYVVIEDPAGAAIGLFQTITI